MLKTPAAGKSKFALFLPDNILPFVSRAAFCSALFATHSAIAGSLGDMVWLDTNGDGVQDAGEPGVAGVSVSLITCDTSQSIASTVTDASGFFRFEDLPATRYQLQFELPSGYAFTSSGASTVDWKDSDADVDSGLTRCQWVGDTRTVLSFDAGLVEATSSVNPPSVLPAEKKNVLFIMADDLRPELGAYGVDAIKTPGIDALAAGGVAFTRAYAQMSTCSPSRTSLLTGLRPDTTQVEDLKTDFRDTIPSVVTLPQYFKQQGYRTQGICKIYHSGLDDSLSWTLPHQEAWGPGDPRGTDGKRLPYAAMDVPESRFGDYKCADMAIDAIWDARDEPFFIAVGFNKPHLPFLAPTEYFSMYDKWAIPEAPNLFRAKDAPDVAFENISELSQYSGISDNPEDFTEDFRRELKRAYYASTSFIDAQVKRVLDGLDAAGLSDNTIVILWGDHGWHLGEQNDWGKHTNFEVGARVPLIIRAPGTVTNQNSDALVEVVDLYPTIVELAGLSIPTTSQHGGYPLEGDSFATLMTSPSTQSRRGAFSQWRRGGYKGTSIRTDGYRYTEWESWNGSKLYELYDHAFDPNETTNVASDPQYSSILPALRQALSAGPQADLPSQLY